MRWLEIEEGHHELSHEPDDNQAAQEKLVKINRWHCEQIAYLAHRLQSIPEPTGDGTMLDHTTIVWTNELGKREFSYVGKHSVRHGGRRTWIQTVVPWIAEAWPIIDSYVDCPCLCHHIPSFGNPEYCEQGPLIL